MGQDWSRSSRCTCGNCVEVALDGDMVLVRDSKNPDQEPLVFDAGEWSDFLAGAADGEFSLDTLKARL